MDIKLQICRLCASPLLLGYNIFAKCDGIDFPELIKKYVYIQVSETDLLPLKLCEECWFTIRKFNEFAIKCTETQEKLFNICLENDRNLLSKDEPQDSIKIEQLEDGIVKVENVVYLETNDDDHFSNGNHSNDGFDVEDPNVRVLQLRKRKQIVYLPKPKVIKKKKENDDEKDDDYVPKQVTLARSVKKTEKKRGRPTKYDYAQFKYLCHVCGTECLNWVLLGKHTISQHNVKPQIKCICNSILIKFKTIRDHIRKHLDKSKNNSCPKCDVMFPSESQMMKHLRRIHKESLFACNSCDETFETKSALYHHEVTHLPRELTHIYRCDECESTFKYPAELKNHKKYSHDKVPRKIQNVICDICGQAYNTKSRLTNHIMRHLNNPRYKCSQCPKKYYSSSKLKVHMDIHLNRQYRCTICSMVLKTKHTLYQHQVTHEEIARYKCRFCEKQYKHNSDLKNHENRHLGITPYPCPWCEKRFVDNSHLRNHKKSQHPNDLAEYEAIHGPPKNAKVKAFQEIDPRNVISLPFKKKKYKSTFLFSQNKLT